MNHYATLSSFQAGLQGASEVVNRAGYFPVLGSAVGVARAVSSIVLGIIGIGAYIAVEDSSLINKAGYGLSRGFVEFIGGIPLVGMFFAFIARNGDLTRDLRGHSLSYLVFDMKTP